MKKFIVAAIAVFAVLIITACATGGKPATGGKSAEGTLSLDQAITACTEELKENVSGKLEIVIAAIKAPDDKTADFLTAELTSQLMRSKSFTVLERGDALKAVNAEQEFQMSGLVSDNSAVGIGHYLGAKIVVTGTFDPYADFSQLRLRAVDVKTSQIVAMPSVRIDPRDRVIANIMPQNFTPPKINVETIDHLARGKDFIREGKYDEAIAAFDMVLAINEDLAEAYFYRAKAYAGRGYLKNKSDYELAVSDYNQAIRINPDYESAYASRGYAYYYLGDYDRALTDIERALRINPNSADAYFTRGHIHERKEDYDRAIADYTKTIQLDPKRAFSYQIRAQTYARKGDYDGAIADYTQAIRLEPNRKRHHYIYYQRGMAYDKKGDYNLAIADYTKAIRLDRNSAFYYYLRGDAYTQKGDYNRAIADFEAALRIDPNDYSAKSGLERARKARGR